MSQKIRCHTSDSSDAQWMEIEPLLPVSRKGRPATHYVIPTIEQLCDVFKVESKGADPITPSDIRSARSYRSALNRELIRRRFGKYSQAWLAKRIGVTARTIQRYVRIEDIQYSQVIHETPLD